MSVIPSFSLFAQDDAGGAIGMIFVLIIELAVAVLVIVAWWKLFEKAGKPGWMAIIPILNMIVLLEISGKPIWWILLLFIPCVNVVVSLFIMIDLAKAFGKDAGFGVGLWLLGFIFFPLLAFSDAKYVGPPAPAHF